MTDLKRKILNDLRVELSDEFDRNFQRKAFFDKPWPPRHVGLQHRGSLLMQTGKLRRSIRCRVDADSVVWETSERYAAIHNYGGTITVTAKMKKYFWYKYNATKDGAWKRMVTAKMKKYFWYKYNATKDDAWKWMALMKVGSRITIPQRQFLGDHPQVRKRAEAVIQRNLQQAAQDLIRKLKP